MAKISKLVAQMKDNSKNVRFSDLAKVCNYYFGDPRQKGTSHCVYKTPWEGDPRINIQDKKGKAIALSGQTGFNCDRQTRGNKL